MSEYLGYINGPEKIIFDNNFQELSHHFDENGRLLSIELLIHRGTNKDFVLTVETFAMNTQRSVASDEKDESAVEGDPTFVIVADEILPDTLLDLKNRPLDELEPFLVKQLDD